MSDTLGPGSFNNDSLTPSGGRDSFGKEFIHTVKDVLTKKSPAKKEVIKHGEIKRERGAVETVLFGSGQKSLKSAEEESKKKVLEKIFTKEGGGVEGGLSASSFKYKLKEKIKDFQIPRSSNKMYGQDREKLAQFLIDEYKEKYKTDFIMKDKLELLLKEKNKSILETAGWEPKPSKEGKKPTPGDTRTAKKEFKERHEFLQQESKS